MYEFGKINDPTRDEQERRILRRHGAAGRSTYLDVAGLLYGGDELGLVGDLPHPDGGDDHVGEPDGAHHAAVVVQVALEECDAAGVLEALEQMGLGRVGRSRVPDEREGGGDPAARSPRRRAGPGTPCRRPPGSCSSQRPCRSMLWTDRRPAAR